ncbi:hypothetical protein [Arthrobacter alpinus]|nr:hypothetical protein [Arthrobacter alpinus]
MPSCIQNNQRLASATKSHAGQWEASELSSPASIAASQAKAHA